MTMGSERWRRPAALLVVVGLLAGMAGCLTDGSDDPPPSRKGSPPAAAGPDPQEDLPRSQRAWHFHDVWGEAQVLTLLDAPVVLSLGPGQVGAAPFSARLGRAVFTLPHGVTVPPETGTLRVTVTFAAAPGVPFTGLNLSHRAPNEENFTSAGAVPLGQPVEVPVAWWTADVPHAKVSGWGFELSATPDARGVAVANGTAHVLVEAVRLREVGIDPPHENWYASSSVLAIAATPVVNVSGVKLADGRYLVRTGTTASVRDALLHVAPRNGTLVPEGTVTVLVGVRWTATAPVDLQVRYEEPNSPSGGLMRVVKEEPGLRLYAVEATPKMWDSPYGFSSAWRFRIDSAGVAGAINPETVRVAAWASREPVESAVALGLAP